MRSAVLFLKPWQLALLLVAAVMLLAVAWNLRAGAETPNLSDPQVLNVRIEGEPGTLDPQRATDADSIAVVRQLYSGLLRFNERQEIAADLAADVPTVENGGISEDGLTYTFTLRDGLKWSDGEPLVAQAFVDGAKHLFEPGSANYYAGFYGMLAADGAEAELAQARADGVEGDALLPLEEAVFDGLQVEAPDDHTVVYHLNAQTPIFPMLATLWALYPIRQDVLDTAGDGWTEAGTLISNGPFALSEWNHDEDLTLTRNDFSHRSPLLETVVIDIIPDSAVAFLAYQQGELDVTAIGPEELVQVRGNDLVGEFINYAQLLTIGWYYNFDDAVLSDVKVRQALAAGVDRTEYAEVVAEGAVIPAYGWIPPGMPGHDSDAGAQYRDAIEQAKVWLAEAGYPDGAGLEIEILSADSSPGVQRDVWLKEQWERNLGITVTIRTLDRAAYFQTRAEGDYQIASGGWFADYPDPQNWLPLFQSGHPVNAGKFSNEQFDALVTEADAELDNERRIDLYLQAQTILIDELGFAPLYYNGRQVLVKPWVHDLTPSSMESNIPGDLFFDQVYIDGRN